MTAGDSKAETTIKLPALVSSPLSRPAPTRRALPAERADQRGSFWMPIRGVPVQCRLTLRCRRGNVSAHFREFVDRQVVRRRALRSTEGLSGRRGSVGRRHQRQGDEGKGRLADGLDQKVRCIATVGAGRGDAGSSDPRDEQRRAERKGPKGREGPRLRALYVALQRDSPIA